MTKYGKKGICKTIIREDRAEENETLERKAEYMQYISWSGKPIYKWFCNVPTKHTS